MADSSLTVRFGGDTSDLNASIAQAKATLASFAPGATGQARAGLLDLAAAALAAKAQSDAANASWRDGLSILADVTTVARGAGSALEVLGEGWMATARASVRAELAVAGFAGTTAIASVQGLNAAVDGASDALTGYFTSAAYAQQGAREFQIANEGLTAAIGRSIIAVQQTFPAAVADMLNRIRLIRSDMVETQLDAIAAAGGIDQFRIALANSDRTPTAVLIDVTAQLQQIPGVSDAAATSIIAMLTAIPDYSTASMSMLVDFLTTFAKTGEQAQAMAKQITDAFRSPDGGGGLADIAQQVQNIEGRLQLAATFAKQLAPAQAVAMYDRLEASLKRQQSVIAAEDEGLRRTLTTMENVGGEADNVLMAAREQLAADEKRGDVLGSKPLQRVAEALVL